MPDILGNAIRDYYQKNAPSTLWIHNRYGDPEEMPVSIYFRRTQDMPRLERLALGKCEGPVLDIGAGAGSHALWLQKNNIEVTALDISAGACEVMRSRGVEQVVNIDVFNYKDKKFKTLLLLMNGIGLSATIDGLRIFLTHAATLLAPGGQIIFDSSDISYLFAYDVPSMQHYYGEIDYDYEYKSEHSGWFRWLYVDRTRLEMVAAEEGWVYEHLHTDQHDQYLGILRRK